MGMPMIREPKNITNIDECAFKIGIDGNDKSSIQKISDSASAGYSSKEQIVDSARIFFEDVKALEAYRSGVVLSLRGGDPIGTTLHGYCGMCNFRKSCNTSREIYKMSGMLLTEAFEQPHVYDD